jgi:hypothetical protein
MKFDDLLMEERPDVQKVRSSHPFHAQGVQEKLYPGRAWCQIRRIMARLPGTSLCTRRTALGTQPVISRSNY